MIKNYSNKIALIKNSRGIYSLDTTIGCKSGMEYQIGGCYGDCYAAKSAKRYGYNFNNTILRNFIDNNHKKNIITKINNIDLDFIRIGCSGDPSENWDHTINIIKNIDKINKEIVIITRHWTLLKDEYLDYFSKINICINTSISALDDDYLINKSLSQYNRLKPYCKSILRIISCDFNNNNDIGKKLSLIQNDLFKNDLILDTVFRPTKNNYFVKNNIINISKGKFLNNENTIISKFKKNTYTGSCSKCHQMCGINMLSNDKKYPDKKGIIKQLKIFKN